MDNIQVSIVYIDELGAVFQQSLTVNADCTIGAAIQSSGFLAQFTAFKLNQLHFGVYSVRKTLEDGLLDGDRIEIYRPLWIDPKDRRRQLVDKKRSAKKWRRELPVKKTV